MDEEKVGEKNSNEANPGDQDSPDYGSEDSFVTPDSSSGRFNIDVSPNEDRSGSGKRSEKHDSKDSGSGSGKRSEKNESKDSGSNTQPEKNELKDSGSNKEPEKNELKDSGSNKQPEKGDSKDGHVVDTAKPLSVKEAVSKFGAIVDWKTHRAQKNERRKFIEQELEKAQEEIPIFKQKSELAEQAKQKALKHLDGTKRLIQELKLNLERAQTEERQAKQDSELAQLRLQELEQGITDESSSVAAKTQLEVAKARHENAASELITARAELEETCRDYEILISERDFAVQKAKEEVSAARELEEEVENLTIQLITTKESIEHIHVSHLETEEHWVHEANERDQELLALDQELKRTEQELEKVKQEIVRAEDLKSKLQTASRLLHSLKDELAVYMQGKVPEEDHEKFTRKDVQSGVAIAKKNLDEVIRNIEKTTEEIMSLKTAAKSLTAQLEGEKQVLGNIRKQKGLGADTVVNLESEMKRARLELEEIRRKEKEAREKLVELPKQLQKAGEDAEHAKLFAEGARLVLKRAKIAADQSKNEASSILSQLATIEKEIEAARAQEKLALGAISALYESESARITKKEDPKGGITITLEEYYELSKRAHDAEEAAGKRVGEAMAQIDEAKESEMQSLNKLLQLNSEIAAQKEALNVALQKAEMAKESKSNIEDELKRRNGETQEDVGLSSRDETSKTQNETTSDKLVASSSSKKEGSSKGKSNTNEGKSSSVRGLFKKKKFMPKFSLMFMGKKKSTSNKHS
ncbi:putative WEB family protein [Helianthus annuus]|nr:putative WEB family protein [Helianthus annuus]